MSVGFKKSLFGFDTKDVLKYIKDTQADFDAKEAALNEKLEELERMLKASKESYDTLASENAELNKKIDDFNAKYSEIDLISENIGKLYLSAQTNALTVMNNSEENAAKTREEVNRNLSTIEESHEALSQLRESINKIANDFSSKVDGLISSLDKIRTQISANNDAVEAAKTDFAEVYASISE